jgi:Holliday junction resolvasome RuvABC endonuclease subunit
MKILSIDIGKVCGVAVWGDGEFIVTTEETPQSLSELADMVEFFISEYEPDLIIIPYPTRFYNVIIAHAKKMGVIERVAEDYDIPVIEVNDSSCKKKVIGSGKAKKEDIMEAMEETSSHIADAKMFVLAYLKDVKDDRVM